MRLSEKVHPRLQLQTDDDDGCTFCRNDQLLNPEA